MIILVLRTIIFRSYLSSILPDKRGSERFVEYRIDDRIYRRRQISQPETHLCHVIGHRTVFFRTYSEQDVQ